MATKTVIEKRSEFRRERIDATKFIGYKPFFLFCSFLTYELLFLGNICWLFQM